MNPPLKSCGFLVLRNIPGTTPRLEFLLMKHADRWDLPKGHVDAGEDELTCALRELEEETGISRDDVRLDSRFRFEHRYEVRSRRTGGRPAPKTLVIFLARLNGDVKLRPTEHLGFEWCEWSPPHRIQVKTIDPLLEELERHLAAHDEPCDGRPPDSVQHRAGAADDDVSPSRGSACDS